MLSIISEHLFFTEHSIKRSCQTYLGLFVAGYLNKHFTWHSYDIHDTYTQICKKYSSIWKNRPIVHRYYSKLVNQFISFY